MGNFAAKWRRKCRKISAEKNAEIARGDSRISDNVAVQNSRIAHTVFVQYVPTRNQPRLKISANIQCLKKTSTRSGSAPGKKTDLLRTHCARPEIIPD